MVDRKIVFYRWQPADDQEEFVAHEMAQELQRAIIADPSNALVGGRDFTTAVRILRVGDRTTPTRLQVLAVRDDENQPVEWSPGRVVRGLMMEEGHFTADVTHVCIWPDGFAAQDWHRYVPRLSRLAFFLRNRIDSRVAFNVLYQQNMITQLRRMRGFLRGAEIGLTTVDGSEIDRTGTLGTLFPAVFGHRAPSVSVRFGMGRYGPRDRYLDPETEGAIFEVAENMQDLMDKMVIRGFDPQAGRVVDVNLISQRIGEDVSVDANPEAVMLPDEDAIFDSIAEVRQTLDDQGLLQEAAQAQAMRTS